MRLRAAEKKNELNKRRAKLNLVKGQATQQQKEADNGTFSMLSFPDLWGGGGCWWFGDSLTNQCPRSHCQDTIWSPDATCAVLWLSPFLGIPWNFLTQLKVSFLQQICGFHGILYVISAFEFALGLGQKFSTPLPITFNLQKNSYSLYQLLCLLNIISISTYSIDGTYYKWGKLLSHHNIHLFGNMRFVILEWCYKQYNFVPTAKLALIISGAK